MKIPATFVAFVLLACTVSAQWSYRDPNAPRLPDGRINVQAPSPRTAAGTVDLSGLWQTDTKYNFNLAVDLKPGDIVMRPWAETLFKQRQDDGHTLQNDPQPTWMGYSKGRWDGDTLIVETTGFNDKTWLDDARHPHSEQMKVTERFRRPSFGQLFVEITIDDPKAYAKPWTVTQAFQLMADGELFEYICNENNLDIPHLVGK